MNIAFDHVLAEARSLSAREKLQLLQVLTGDLQQQFDLEAGTAQFWQSRDIDELVAFHQTPVVHDVTALDADFWPADETTDDITAFVDAQRRADRQRNQ